MATTQEIDWTDVEAAGKALAGAWRDIPCFCWHRGYELEDADRWMLWYSSSRDAGLLEQSNEKVFNERLRPFSEGDDPDLVFERHSHWAVGYLDGFSIRVYRPDGSITPAFKEFCRIKEALEDYPILDERADYSEREYLETLDELPQRDVARKGLTGGLGVRGLLLLLRQRLGRVHREQGRPGRVGTKEANFLRRCRRLACCRPW